MESVILGFQHSFLALGIITLTSSLIVPHMGGSNVLLLNCYTFLSHAEVIRYIIAKSITNLFFDFVILLMMKHDKAKVIQSMMFVSAINTLVQTLVGTRLPVVIGASHAFVFPVTSIVLSIRLSCPNPSQVPPQVRSC